MPRVIQVTMHKAKSQLSQLAERLWAGDRVVITRAGKPYLDLLPYQPQVVERKPGSLKGRIWNELAMLTRVLVESWKGR